MEIYKDLSSKASKEFEKLLNSQLSKTNIEEGKIIEGKINKVTEKFVFLFVEGLKSEPVLDINELKSMGLSENIKLAIIVPCLNEQEILTHTQTVLSTIILKLINQNIISIDSKIIYIDDGSKDETKDLINIHE